MMPVRYSAMNKNTGTGPSSMMAAIMVTAATCNQNEKIEKQTSIFVPDDASKLKVPSNGKYTHNQHFFCHYLGSKKRKEKEKQIHNAIELCICFCFFFVCLIII